MSLRPASAVPLAVADLALRQAFRGLPSVGQYLPLSGARFARVMNVSKTGIAEDIETGTIDVEVAAALATILRAHTSTPADCYFLVWEGYGPLLPGVRDGATVTLEPNREMHVLAGDLSDGAESIEEPPFARTALWWIPADGAWLVGNDIYGASVYVAASESAIAAILASEELESHAVEPTDELIAELFD
ncbi:MAG: hypothetical protein QOF79_2288 [Actinomycetota bacterium]|nr:hypothetical protein [Actinomycetota bacterium]